MSGNLIDNLKHRYLEGYEDGISFMREALYQSTNDQDLLDKMDNIYSETLDNIGRNHVQTSYD